MCKLEIRGQITRRHSATLYFNVDKESSDLKMNMSQLENEIAIERNDILIGYYHHHHLTRSGQVISSAWDLLWVKCNPIQPAA